MFTFTIPPQPVNSATDTSMPAPSAPSVAGQQPLQPQQVTEQQIHDWWNSLTPEQQAEIRRVHGNLSPEDQLKIQQARQVQPQGQMYVVSQQPQYVYIRSSGSSYGGGYSGIHFYDYYTMYFLSRNLAPLIRLDIKMNMAIMKGVVDIGAKVGHGIANVVTHVAPTIIQGAGQVGSTILHGAGSVGSSALQGVGNIAKSGVGGLETVGSAAYNGGKSVVQHIGKGGSNLAKAVKGGGSGCSNFNCGGSGGDDPGIMLIIIIVVGAILAFAAAIATAVSFAGYAIKKMYDSAKHLLKGERKIEGVLTISAVAGGTALGAIKGALVGALIGTAIPGLGTAVGAVLGAVIGACVSAGVFAAIGRGISRLFTRAQVELDVYGPKDDLICKVHPEEYQLTEQDKHQIETTQGVDFDDNSNQRIQRMMTAVHTQREHIDAWKYLPRTKSSGEYDAYKVMLKDGIKTGALLSKNSFLVADKHLFEWDDAKGEFEYSPMVLAY